MNKTVLRWIPLFLIIVLAIALRLFRLGHVPIELNRDEASLGYTAFSILHTGREEHGVVWPITIESFGDWKLPVYVYTLIPFIYVFGLTNIAVKLPSFLAGICIVLFSGVLVWLLTTKWKNKNHRIILTTLTTLLIAVSPWNIHMSHMAYEANLAMALMLGAVILLLTALQYKKYHLLLIPSTVLFGLTFFTYHSYQVFVPLLILSITFIYWNTIQKRVLEHTVSTSIAGLVAIFFVFSLIITSSSANKTKFSGLSIFDKNSYAEIVEINRGYFPNRNSLFAKIHTNTFSLIFNQAQRNIADIFSSRFLFFEGGTHGSHDIAGTGKMYPIEFIFLLVGLYSFLILWQNKKLEKWHTLIFAWLIAATVAPFITFEAAHTIRFSPALFPLSFISAYGLFIVLTKKKPSLFYKTIIAIILFILAYSVLSFLLTYFVVAPQRDINTQNWQIRRLVELVNERKDQYDLILMPGTEWSPYIYFLYSNQVNPNSLNEQIQYLPPDNEGFRHVVKYDKIDFSPVDWNEHQDKKILYVIKRKEVPMDKLESEAYQIEYSLTNPNAKDEWLLISKQ